MSVLQTLRESVDERIPIPDKRPSLLEAWTRYPRRVPSAESYTVPFVIGIGASLVDRSVLTVAIRRADLPLLQIEFVSSVPDFH